MPSYTLDDIKSGVDDLDKAEFNHGKKILASISQLALKRASADPSDTRLVAARGILANAQPLSTHQMDAIDALLTGDTNALVDFINANLPPGMAPLAFGAAAPASADETLSGGLSKWVKAYDENGNEVTAANREDIARQQQLIADGYMPVETNGILEKFQKPRAVAPPPSTPTSTLPPPPAIDPDMDVDVRDPKTHKVVDTVKYGVGHKDDSLEYVGAFGRDDHYFIPKKKGGFLKFG